jgi:hypothetical protein
MGAFNSGAASFETAYNFKGSYPQIIHNGNFPP